MARSVVKALSSIAVGAACIAAVATTAATVSSTSTASESLVPPGITPSGPIVVLTNLQPGESRTSPFEVSNANTGDAQLAIGGRLTGGDATLYDTLDARIENAGDGATIWSGQLGGLDSPTAAGVLAAGGTRAFRIVVGVPTTAGDGFQARSSQFDLNFSLTSDAGAGSADREPPVSAIGRRSIDRLWRIVEQRSNRRVSLRFSGTARDAHSGVARIQVSLVRVVSQRVAHRRVRRCMPYVLRHRRFVRSRRKSCSRVWIDTWGAPRWHYRFANRHLGPGHYKLRVRAIDNYGNVEKTFRMYGPERNVIKFNVRG